MPKFTLPSLKSRRRPGRRIVTFGVAIAALAGIAFAGQAAYSSSGSYVVQPGDSLWAISRKAGVSMQALAAANHMQLSDVLLIGRHLVIPSSGSAQATATAEETSGSPATRPSSGGDFCASFSPVAGPRGVLPAGLTSSGRLWLRPLFEHWGSYYGVSPALLEAIAWQESGWQSGVVSSAQAVGVGQLLPSTADFVSGQLIGVRLDINSAADNVRMMARYVAYLQSVEGSTCRTVAAYYEGTHNMAVYGVLPVSQPYVANVESLVGRFE